MKGLISAAGAGKRLRPYTNAIPKELSLIGDTPVIVQVIEALTVPGMKDIMVIISRTKHAILDYYGSGKGHGVHLTYVVQEAMNGLAKAVKVGKHLIDGTFVVVNGYDFFYPKTLLKDLSDFHFDEKANITIDVFEAEDVMRHGLIKSIGN